MTDESYSSSLNDDSRSFKNLSKDSSEGMNDDSRSFISSSNDSTEDVIEPSEIISDHSGESDQASGEQDDAAIRLQEKSVNGDGSMIFQKRRAVRPIIKSDDEDDEQVLSSPIRETLSDSEEISNTASNNNAEENVMFRKYRTIRPIEDSDDDHEEDQVLTDLSVSSDVDKQSEHEESSLKNYKCHNHSKISHLENDTCNDPTIDIAEALNNSQINNDNEENDVLKSIHDMTTQIENSFSKISDLKSKKSNNRISFHNNEVLSSTMIDGDDSPPSSILKNVKAEPDNSKTYEIESDSIDIISDSDDEKREAPTSKMLKQPTLVQMLRESKIEFDKPDLMIPATTSEYNRQQELIQSLRSELLRLQNILMTIQLSTLPDKGLRLKTKMEEINERLLKEEEKLSNMFVKENEMPATALKPATWEQLQDVASAVQPRTFGKTAMKTYNAEKALTMERLENLHGSLKSCPGEDVLAEDPKGLKVELMRHQKRALAWMSWRETQKPSGGILADDMGLGKTLSLISLIMKQQSETKSNDEKENTDDDETRFKYQGGTLVICPASLIGQWDTEIKKRVKSNYFRVELHHGANREMRSKKRLSRNDIVITTYQTVMMEMEKDTALFKIRWNRIILDEAHQVRNHKSKTSTAVCKLAANSRWVLTGTPIHNKEVDLYALLKFLRVSPFDDLAVFKRWVSDKNAGGQERLNTVISSIMLRRTKAQLMEGGALECLPKRHWEIINIKLPKEEMDVYQKVLIFSRTLFAEFLHQRAGKNQDYNDQQNFGRPNDPNGEYYKMHQKLVRMNRVKEVKQHEILVLLLRLRQICCHPSLITSMLHDEDLGDCGDEDNKEELSLLDQINKLSLEDEDESHHNVAANLAQEGVSLSEATRGILNPSNPIFNSKNKSAKIRAVLNIVKEKVLVNNDKCIVVSQWTSLLKIVAEQLKSENIKFDTLDGSIPVPKRGPIIDRFNNPNIDIKVLLLSLTAGGVGLNLIGANHLLLMDLHWNPQLELQAQDRIYRVGQQKPVFIYKFMAVDTIEERIKALQDKKKSIAQSVLTGSKIQQSGLSLQDLKMLFNF